jgi:hypothetical protein
MGTPVVLADAVLVTTATTGTGTYALGSAVTGYFHPSDHSLNGSRVSYVVVDSLTTPTIREVGEGVLASGSPWTLTRATIRRSLTGGVAGGSAINWAAGTKYVFLAPIAANSPQYDTAGELRIAAGTNSLPGLYPTGDADTGLFSPGANIFAITTGGTERLRVDGNGIVRLGTTADVIVAGETLSVRGSVGAKNPTAGTPGIIAASSNDTTVCAWYNNAGSQVGSITSAGGASVAYNTTSDARLKIVDGPLDAGPVIDAVVPVLHRWAATPDAPAIPGFLAQEVKLVVPHAVADGHGAPGDADFVPMQLDQSRLVALLWAEVRSLRARVAALEAA